MLSDSRVVIKVTLIAKFQNWSGNVLGYYCLDPRHNGIQANEIPKLAKKEHKFGPRCQESESLLPWVKPLFVTTRSQENIACMTSLSEVVEWT